MLKLIIAEKPTLARLIVDALGKSYFTKQDGYYESRKFVVTYAFGHLFEEYDIEDYIGEEGKRWTLDILPFCPPNRVFNYRLIMKKNSSGKRVTDPGIMKQFKTIKALINRPDISEIIHAGDADREGEILLRLVIRNANPSNKPVMRLWVQEQTEGEIRGGITKVVPDSFYDNLANEGFARAYTDWLDGINLTRYFSIKAKAPMGQPFRLGRVICAMVTEIYDRDMAIEHFVPVPYLVIQSNEETNGVKVLLRCKKKYGIEERADAEKRCTLLNASPAVVQDVETSRKEIGAGKLYSLTSLQNALLKRFKMPLTRSKEIIQKVYEAGYITYPRTNTEYLGESEKEKAEALVALFNKHGFDLEFKDKKSIFDSSKIESHSAIIPTYKIPADLAGDEQKVYETVRNRFLAVFCKEKCLVDRTVISIICVDETFKLKGDVLVQKGFTKYDDVTITEKPLPSLKKGDIVNTNFEVLQEETKPPKHYTAATFNSFLLSPFRKTDMEDANEGEEDKTEEKDDSAVYKDIMAGVEIGTVASRTDIIAKIIANRYITEEKGTYRIAPAGVYLVETMKLLGIDVNKHTTAQMSVLLKKVNHGEMTINDAIDVCMKHLTEIMTRRDMEVPGCTEAGAVGKVNKYGKPCLGKCPVCGGDVYESPKAYTCERNTKDSDDCNFVLWKDDKYFAAVYKKKITAASAVKILQTKSYSEKGSRILLVVDPEKKRCSWQSGNTYRKGSWKSGTKK